MAARRGAKAIRANTGPQCWKAEHSHWLLEHIGFWERTFKQKADRSLSLALPHAGTHWDCSGLRPYLVGSQLPEAGSRPDMHTSQGSSLWDTNDPVQHSTQVLDCFYSLALRAAHGGMSW